MSVLTRVPRQLRTQLAAADPAREVEAADPPDVELLIARAEAEEPIALTPLALAPVALSRVAVARSRPRRLRVLAPVAAVAVVVGAAAVLVATRSGDRDPARPQGSVVAGGFPVRADPRPIVAIGDTVLAGDFPSGDTKLAFESGAIDLATALPATSGDRHGYPVLPARTAVRQLTGQHSCCAGTSTRLEIVGITLVDHAFDTDRGAQRLPAWQVEFRGVAYDTYVLAVATSARYPHRLTGYPASSGDVTVSADGRRLTVWVMADHESRDPCDITYGQTLTTKQAATGVRLTVDTSFHELSPPPTKVAGQPMACDLIGHVLHPQRAPKAGESNTRTITLDQPLGNRIVVDQHGVPYVVTTG